MGKSVRARTVLYGIGNIYLMEQEHDKHIWRYVGNHVKSGKDLEQEKPAVYQEHSDRNGLRDLIE